MSVTLRRERTEERWRVMMSEERVIRLDIENSVEIRRLSRLKGFESDR